MRSEISDIQNVKEVFDRLNHDKEIILDIQYALSNLAGVFYFWLLL